MFHELFLKFPPKFWRYPPTASSSVVHRQLPAHHGIPKGLLTRSFPSTANLLYTAVNPPTRNLSRIVRTAAWNGRFPFQAHRRQGLLRWRQRQVEMGRLQHAGLAADPRGWNWRYLPYFIFYLIWFWLGRAQLHFGLRCKYIIFRRLRRSWGARGVAVLLR